MRPRLRRSAAFRGAAELEQQGDEGGRADRCACARARAFVRVRAGVRTCALRGVVRAVEQLLGDLGLRGWLCGRGGVGGPPGHACRGVADDAVSPSNLPCPAPLPPPPAAPCATNRCPSCSRRRRRRWAALATLVAPAPVSSGPPPSLLRHPSTPFAAHARRPQRVFAKACTPKPGPLHAPSLALHTFL